MDKRLSALSPEEMAGRSTLADTSPLLRTYQYAAKEAIHWSSKKENCCNLLWTSGAASRLRALCPDAQWVDISEGWLTDNP